MQTRKFSYNLLRITKKCRVCACAGISGEQIFINIPLFTFIHTLLSLKYYAPDTRSSVNICHSSRFLTLSRTSDATQVSFLVSLSVK